jgi:hypothetical protein
VFILRLWCPVCRQRTCVGLIPHVRSPTGCAEDQETEKWPKYSNGLYSNNNNNRCTFWYIVRCDSLKVNLRSGGRTRLHLRGRISQANVKKVKEKVVLVLKYAVRHEGVWGGCTDASFLYLGTSWR